MSDTPINVLLIEDNPADVQLITEMLTEGERGRFALECTDRLSLGLERLLSNNIGIVLLDLGLPDSQGFETFAKTQAQAPEVPIVVLSDLADETMAMKTVHEGAQNYVVKGQLNSYSLAHTIRYAIERKQAEEDLRAQALIFENIHDGIIVTDLEGNIIRWNPAAEKMFGYYKDEVFHKTLGILPTHFIKGTLRDGRWAGEMNFTHKDGKQGTCETTVIPLYDERGTIRAVFGVSHDITKHKQAEQALQRSYDKLRETLIVTVNTLASTVEMRDPYTAGHQRRVTILACAIAEELGLTEEQFDGLRLAGLVHDIGKFTVPVEILNKPGRISETEFNIIKTHPQAGYNLLKEIEFPWPVAQIVLQHHERLDGSGYPQGLKNGGIMLEAKILAVADVVEAMASHRPYRPALGIEVALEEITKNKGVLYDPDVVDVCSRLFIDKGFVLGQQM
jgi:PAS domain S-box-containing protein/putative nucleotidyltransferase with HDIG domain